MPETKAPWRWLPQSLMGRLSLVMLTGVLVTQLAGSAIWASQVRAKAEEDVRSAAQYMGYSAANTVRFFRSVPPNYRRLLIAQLRDMGGTRFFVSFGHEHIPIREMPEEGLTRAAKASVLLALRSDLPQLNDFRLAFSWPDQLTASTDGSPITDLPDAWVKHILLIKPEPAPVLVIQIELEPGNWLYLASLMPNPYFLNSNDPLSFDRLVLQGLSLAAVLLLSFLVVARWITRPLAALAKAAEAFGKDERLPTLPDTGTREVVSTARAFGAMRERIQKYLEDRERLFISISHDLRTPITRLKLRSELLEDDNLRLGFEEDLDELDMMVKGALQCVKDSDIHENVADVRLDPLLHRMIRGARLSGHVVAYRDCGLSVRAKPLALKRAIGNLLDNALFYGQSAEIAVLSEPGWIEIRIRDHGPGVPEEALARLFDPHVRLSHGRTRNESGMGLGLGIARSIVQAHGGEVLLSNHPEGGLLARVRLPVQPTSVEPEAAV